MGQICIHKNYRGQGLFDALYQKHRTLHETEFDCLITSISTRNHRSLRAHERVGFKILNTYKETTEEWVTVVWDWS